MSKSKSPGESAAVSHKLVMPNEINSGGLLLGGVLMSWTDKTASMAAQKHAGHPHVVTVNLDQIHFKYPLRVGDHVVLSSSVDYVGRTSMEISVTVEKEDHLTDEKAFAASASLTFVALDENSKPTTVPRLTLSTPEEIEKHQRARLRVQVRGRLHNWFQDRFPDAFRLKAV